MKALSCPSPLSCAFLGNVLCQKNAVSVPPSWDCDFWRQATRAAARRPNSSSGYWGAPGAEGQESGVSCEIMVFDTDVLKFHASCRTCLSDQALALVSRQSTMIGLEPTSTLLHLPACVVLSPKIAKTMSVSPRSKLWTALVPVQATNLKGPKLAGLSTHHLCVFLRTGLQCWLSKIQVWKMILAWLCHGCRKSARNFSVPGKISKLDRGALNWHKHERPWTALITSHLLFERPQCPNNAGQWKGRMVWPVRHHTTAIHCAMAKMQSANSHAFVQLMQPLVRHKC